jgi:hypothetical protein
MPTTALLWRIKDHRFSSFVLYADSNGIQGRVVVLHSAFMTETNGYAPACFTDVLAHPQKNYFFFAGAAAAAAAASLPSILTFIKAHCKLLSVAAYTRRM